MLAVSVEMLPLILAGFWDDEAKVTRYSLNYAIVTSSAYLVLYLQRRMRISAPTPFPSLVVMVGYAIWMPFLAVVSLGSYFELDLAIIAAYSFWCLFSGVVIFVSFLGTFVDTTEVPIDATADPASVAGRS